MVLVNGGNRIGIAGMRPFPHFSDVVADGCSIAYAAAGISGGGRAFGRKGKGGLFGRLTEAFAKITSSTVAVFCERGALLPAINTIERIGLAVILGEPRGFVA